MQIMSQKPAHCQKHNKTLQILVVNEALYICQDCAIFDSKYKCQALLQKQSIELKIQSINQHCLNIEELENVNQKSINENLSSIIHMIEGIQSELIDNIKKQFEPIKTKVQKYFLSNVSISERERNNNGKWEFSQLEKELSPQYKIKRENQSRQNLAAYEKYLETQLGKINQFYRQLKKDIEKNAFVKIDVQSAFEKIIQGQSTKMEQMNQLLEDDDLLDFSQFSIEEQNIQPQIPSFNFNFNQDNAMVESQVKFFKRPHVERMKTAPCLQDSMFSIDQTPKLRQNNNLNIPINQINCLNQSILSDRSISCSSVISKALTCSTVMTKQPSKKTIIEVTSMGELQTKLLSISPTIKIIKLCNIPISNQQFCSILKEKISKSFIHTLEISGCPKLNDKMLMDLKSFRCKTLKKIQIKECKEIKWTDKKVKEFVKKLETDSVKVIY